MATVTCDRCGAESPPKVRGFDGAIAQGWGKFEALKEDGGDALPRHRLPGLPDRCRGGECVADLPG